MSVSLKTVRELLLQEVKSFQCDIKERLQRLSENVESIIMSSKLNLLDSHALDSSYSSHVDGDFKDDNFPALSSVSSSSYHEDNKNKTSLVISNKKSNCTQIIDLSDFFDDLEVPQLKTADSFPDNLPQSSKHLDSYSVKKTDLSVYKDVVSSNTPSPSTNVDPDIEITSSYSYNGNNKVSSQYEEIIVDSDDDNNDVDISDVDDDNNDVDISDDDDDVTDQDWQLQLNEKSQQASSSDSDFSSSEVNCFDLKNGTSSLENPSVMNAYLATASISKMEKAKVAKPTVVIDPFEFKQQIVTLIDPETGLKVFECPVCNLKSRTLRDMHRHTPVHTGERRFPCIICNKRFKRSSHMKSHMLTHTGERPHHCDECPKRFCSKSSLKYHKDSHRLKEKEAKNLKNEGIPIGGSKDRPFVCNICDRQFRQKSHRELHMRVHSNVKKYVCVVCTKAFRRKEHLARHLRTHTGERPFKCKECSKDFSDSSTLSKHKKAVHLLKSLNK